MHTEEMGMARQPQRTELVARVRQRPGPRRGGTSAAAGTRDDLLRAGAHVFAERGFDGATAELISRRAGTTKAMINYHFRSKKGLYEEILLANFVEIAGRLDAVRAGEGAAPEQLRAFIEAFAQAAADHPEFPPMMVREALAGGTHLPEGALLRIEGIVRVVKAIVEQGIEEGSFRPVDPLLTHVALIGSLLYFLAIESFRAKAAARIRAPGGPPTTAAFIAHVQEMMVRGLAAGTAAPRGRS
jgi:TetR/AcrR family transcriptional regulator